MFTVLLSKSTHNIIILLLLINILFYLESDEILTMKTSDKRSYNQSQLVWIKEAGLQADIQKILRQARKMPDKIPSFYKVTIILDVFIF